MEAKEGGGEGEAKDQRGGRRGGEGHPYQRPSVFAVHDTIWFYIN